MFHGLLIVRLSKHSLRAIPVLQNSVHSDISIWAPSPLHVSPELMTPNLGGIIQMFQSYRSCFLHRCKRKLTNCPRIPPAVSMPTSTAEAVRVGTKDWWTSSPAAQRTSTIKAKNDHRHFHETLEEPRKARNSKRPRIKYSMTCADFLINVCIKSIAWDEISGARKRKMVSTTENVFWEENVPVDIQKLKPIQKITGSQYLMKSRSNAIQLSQNDMVLSLNITGFQWPDSCLWIVPYSISKLENDSLREFLSC